MTSARLRSALLVAALVAGMTGCGVMGDDRKEDVTAQLDAVWRAAGFDPDDTTQFGYGFTRRDGTECEDVDPDERWFADRDGKAPAGKVTRERILDGVHSLFEDDGYEVVDYKSSASEQRIVKARNDRFNIEIFVGPAGDTTVRVRMSPCARNLSLDAPDPYVRVDE